MIRFGSRELLFVLHFWFQQLICGPLFLILFSLWHSNQQLQWHKPFVPFDFSHNNWNWKQCKWIWYKLLYTHTLTARLYTHTYTATHIHIHLLYVYMSISFQLVLGTFEANLIWLSFTSILSNTVLSLSPSLSLSLSFALWKLNPNTHKRIPQTHTHL